MFLLSSEVGNLFEQLTFSIAKLAYMLIGSMYKLFFSLANAQLFNNELISSFTNRIYYIIGVVMLFVFVYIILTNIINPDGGKGKNSPISVIKNVVIALAIIVFTPTMFELAYSVQSSVFENNVIGRLVLGGSSSDTETYDSANGFVSTLLNSSFSVDSDAPEGALVDLENAEFLLSYDGDFSGYEALINSSNEYISYNGLISLIVACFSGWVMIGYLLDVALRAFKLGFLQVIAPVPAILSIVPNQTKILSSWIKETLKTFFEVFLKIAALMFIVFMIGQVNNNLSDIFGNNGFFYRAFIIIGLFSFLNILPKLLSQIFGFSDASGMLDIGSKWKNFTGGMSTYLKPAWALAGATYANVHSHNIAKKTGRKHTFGEIVSTTTTGLYGGWKHGMKFGNVQEMQDAHEKLWSNEEYQSQSGLHRFGSTMLNGAAGWFGFKHVVDRELDIDDIVFNERNSEFEHNIREINSKFSDSVRNIENKYSNTQRLNNLISTEVNKLVDYVESEANKESCGVDTNKAIVVSVPTIKKYKNKQGKVVEKIVDENQQLNNFKIKKLIDTLQDPNSVLYNSMDSKARENYIANLKKARDKNYQIKMEELQTNNDTALLSYYETIDTIRNTYGSSLGRHSYLDANNNQVVEDLFSSEISTFINDKKYGNLDSLKKAIKKSINSIDSQKQKDLANQEVTVNLIHNGRMAQEKLTGLTREQRIEEISKEKKELSEEYSNKQIVLQNFSKARNEVHKATPRMFSDKNKNQ